MLAGETVNPLGLATPRDGRCMRGPLGGGVAEIILDDRSKVSDHFSRTQKRVCK